MILALCVLSVISSIQEEQSAISDRNDMLQGLRLDDDSQQCVDPLQESKSANNNVIIIKINLQSPYNAIKEGFTKLNDFTGSNLRLLKQKYAELPKINVQETLGKAATSLQSSSLKALNTVGELTMDFMELKEQIRNEHPEVEVAFQLLKATYQVKKQYASTSGAVSGLKYVISTNKTRFQLNTSIDLLSKIKPIKKAIKQTKLKYEAQIKCKVDDFLNGLAENEQLTEKGADGLKILAGKATRKALSSVEKHAIQMAKLPLNFTFNYAQKKQEKAKSA